MYRLCFNASRILHRVLMGSRRRRVSVTPSSRHGHAVAEAAVAGTRAQTSGSRHERARKVPTGPLNGGRARVFQRRALAHSDTMCVRTRIGRVPPWCSVLTEENRWSKHTDFSARRDPLGPWDEHGEGFGGLQPRLRLWQSLRNFSQMTGSADLTPDLDEFSAKMCIPYMLKHTRSASAVAADLGTPIAVSHTQCDQSINQAASGL